MSRTIKDATVKRFHHDDQEQLRQHPANFIGVYDLGRRPRILKGLTLYGAHLQSLDIIARKILHQPSHMPGMNS